MSKLKESKKRFRAIKSSNYDVSNTCNLTCEGCCYFVSNQKVLNKRPNFEQYDRFFASEVARGINYPVFGGGEPSLNIDALRAAAKHWRYGIVYTNGAIKIDQEIPFRIAISVWGDRIQNDKLRGDGRYDQALKTAQDDSRALIYITINRYNIEDISTVVSDCVDRGLKISFNDFSMTTEYIRLLTEEKLDGSFMRFSTNKENLSLRQSDRLKLADIIDEMIERYPQNILYSKLLNDWTHRSDAIHFIDPDTGIATDCGTLNADWHKTYNFNLEPLESKPCCAPEFDCRDCRIGPAATWTLMMRLSEKMHKDQDARQAFLELREEMMRFYFWDWEELGISSQAQESVAPGSKS
jgi:MoaA/NifB/PqqE/SkfB family radical SAM enzyme